MILTVILLSIIVVYLIFRLLYKLTLSQTIKQEYVEPKGFKSKFILGFIIFMSLFLLMMEWFATF